MTNGQSDNKLVSHILLSTFGSYEHAENIRSISKNKINLYIDTNIYVSKDTSLMFLTCFLVGLTNNSPINAIFLAGKLHTKSQVASAFLIRFIL